MTGRPEGNSTPNKERPTDQDLRVIPPSEWTRSTQRRLQRYMSQGPVIGGTVVEGDTPCNGRIVIYIIKADETSYINYMKPLILARVLRVPHVISVVDTKDEWYRNVHPERYVPAMKDEDESTRQPIFVFESTACLQYLAERFDRNGLWSGQSAAERAQVLSWTAYQTAGLGPTAKYWLYFLKGYPTRAHPESLPKTVAKLHENCQKQWDVMEARLSQQHQQYIALPDRPSLADISYLPFAMPWMFGFMGTNIAQWPAISAWSKRMLEVEAVRYVLEMGPMYGH